MRRKRGESRTGRRGIPTARYADLNRDLAGPVTPDTGRHPLPDPAQLARRLRGFGVTEQSQVVTYDDGGGAFAARAWWLVRWLGFERVAVLDGGLKAWNAMGGPLENSLPETGARSGTKFPGPPPDRQGPVMRVESVVETQGLVQLLQDSRHVLVDARARPNASRATSNPWTPWPAMCPVPSIIPSP